MEHSQFYCLNCSSSYNLTTRIPVMLECGDEICLDCYKNKLVQKQDGTLACCIDNEHEIERRENPIQNRKIINKLKSMDLLRLACEKHIEQYSEYYCSLCDEIVCKFCSQIDHQHVDQKTLHQVKPQNFKEYLKYINPLFDKQLEMITTLKHKFNAHINESQILSSRDFVSMLNDTKLLLKDFVQKEDIPKLLITHYKLQGQVEPQEVLNEQIDTKIKYSENFNLNYNEILPKVKSFAEYQYMKLVNCEIQKLSSSLISTQLKDWNRANIKLLYKGTTDSFEATKFHQLCDNQGPTISFVLSELGHTFGGYTSISWTSDGAYKEDRQAFLFQLNQRSIHPIENNFDKAVQHHPDYHLIFGSGNDLCLYNQCDVNKSSDSYFGHAYKLPPGYTQGTDDARKYLAGEYQFKVLEIEVYSVMIP
eukprot:403358051